jgi:NAD(P) transhydrogenase subunit alpha
MIESMRPGSIIVDLAAERGGNAELTKPGEIAEHKGVRIFGLLNLPGRVPVNASSLYARNLQAFIDPFIDKDEKTLAIDWDDELAKGTGIARDGAIVNETIAERLGGKSAKPAGATGTATKPAPAKAKANGGAKAPAKKSGSTRQPKGGKTT